MSDYCGDPGSIYRPSSGTEGMVFMDDWCASCDRDAAFRRDPDRNPGCDIIARTMALKETDPRYPTEWIYDENGSACCTAWCKEEKDGEAPRCEKTIDLFQGART